MVVSRRRIAVGMLAAASLVAVAQGAVAWVQYDEVAASVGVPFRHAGEVHPPTADDPLHLWPAFPEQVSPGACWADFDGDGYQDLYLVDAQFNPENPGAGDWADALDPMGRLYINAGDGTFADRTAASGVEARRFGNGCSAADYDGDGDMDLFVSVFGDDRWGGNLLYRNDGDNRFTEVGAAAGVEMLNQCGDSPCWGTSSAWADYDLDGDLDLYAANFVESSLTDSLRGPSLHKGQKNFLFRNNANGTFTNVADDAGVAGNNADEHGSKTHGVVWFDCELDGDLDLFVANDLREANFYINHGDGTFTEEAADRGVDDHRANMGVAAADYDNDGYPDLFITHFAGEQAGFYRNLQDCTFEDRSGEDELVGASDKVGWGTHFVDLDRDMDLDLFVVNGDIQPRDDNRYPLPSAIYRQDPNLKPGVPAADKNWTDQSQDSGPGIQEVRVSRGLAMADYDFDGDVDAAVGANANETALFLRASGVTNHWLLLELRQPGMNRHAVGARVILEAGGVTQYREVQAGSSYLSQNALALDFGLGSHIKADRVTIQWPGGGTTLVTDLAADQAVRIDRATGAVLADFLSPLTTVTIAGTPGSNGWWVSDVTATLSAVDRGVSVVSGLAATEFAIDGGPWTPYAAGQTFAFFEGDHRLDARSRDAAGNVEPRRTQPVRVDFTPPTLVPPQLDGTLGDNGWWRSENVTVRLDPQDALSGVDEIRFRVDGANWSTYAGPFNVTGDGVHALEHFARDRAGNQAPGLTTEILIDHTPPNTTLLTPAEGGIYVGAQSVATLPDQVTLIVSSPTAAGVGGWEFPVRAFARDATSGMSHIEFRLNDTLMAQDNVFPFVWKWDTRTAPSGGFNLDAVGFDRAGNPSKDGLDVVLVSGTPEGVLVTLLQGPSLGPLLESLLGLLPLVASYRPRHRSGVAP